MSRAAPPVQHSRPVDALPAFEPRFWLALAGVAVLSGLGGGLLMRLLYAVQDLAWNARPDAFYEAVLRASPARTFLALGAAAVLVGAGALFLRSSRNGHAGDLVEAIWFADGRMPSVRTLLRAVLSVVVVGLGAAVGREGALKQTGAVIGWGAAHRLRLSAEQRRVLTACGAGAGMAAAYNIPLAGALFAAEVLLGSVSFGVTVPALACAVSATAVSWLLLPMRLTYATPVYSLSPNLLLWALLAGPLIGGCVVGYVRLIGWAGRRKPQGVVAKLLAPAAVFAALALAALAFPEMVGNGKDVVQLAFDGGDGDPRLGSVGVLAGLAVARALATALCLRSGAPGGLFTPTLTCGALLGEGGGRLWAWLRPGDPPGGYAVIGAAAMLAAATGGPLSAVAAVLELGQHIDGLVAPILLATAGACLVVRVSGSPSIYTVRIRDKPGP